MKINRSKIEIILAQKRMTRASMASKASISRQSISTILTRGTCEPRTLGRIAAALEVDVEQLIAKEG